VLGHYTATRDVLRQAECLEVMGSLYALRPAERDTAARCYDLAQSLAERVGAHALSARVRQRAAELRAAVTGDELPRPAAPAAVS
jgi:hypothetical protein